MKKPTSVHTLFAAVCSLVLLSVHTVSAQAMISKTTVTPMQAGTVTLTQGHATVGLAKEVTEEMNNKEVEPSYYVVLTPVGTDSKPVLTDITDRSFTVNSTEGNTQVQYVVFVKETITMPDLHAMGQATHTTTAIQVGK